MKILIWSPTGVGNHYSGPATSTHRLFTELKQQFPNIELALVHGSDEQDESSPLFETQFKILSIHKIGQSKGHFVNKFHYLSRSYSWVKRNSSSYDLIYMPVSNIYTLVPLLWFRSLRKPVITRLAVNHELHNNNRLKKTIRFSELRVWFIKKSQMVIAISSDISKRLRQLGVPSDKVVDLPNLVDTDKYRPVSLNSQNDAKMALGLTRKHFVVSIVGSICPRKNQISLLKAVNSLPKDIHVVFAGPFLNDSYERQIRTIVNELNLNERITFTGHLDEVVCIYAASDVYCLPSKAEGMPNSLLEAMSSGLPAIASDIEGNRDLIGDGTTRGLFTDGTPESLSNQIIRLYGDRDYVFALGQNARSFIEENHSYMKNVPKLYNEFLTLVKR